MKRARAECSVCLRPYAVKDDGSFFPHNKWPEERNGRGWPIKCDGKPTSFVPTEATVLGTLIEIRELLRTIHDVVTRQP